MITMQLTPKDIADAIKVIEAAVDRGDLTAAQVRSLYHAAWVAQSKVGTTFELVPAPARRGRRPLWGLRSRVKALDPGQT